MINSLVDLPDILLSLVLSWLNLNELLHDAIGLCRHINNVINNHPIILHGSCGSQPLIIHCCYWANNNENYCDDDDNNDNHNNNDDDDSNEKNTDTNWTFQLLWGWAEFDKAENSVKISQKHSMKISSLMNLLTGPLRQIPRLHLHSSCGDIYSPHVKLAGLDCGESDDSVHQLLLGLKSFSRLISLGVSVRQLYDHPFLISI